VSANSLFVATFRMSDALLMRAKSFLGELPGKIVRDKKNTELQSFVCTPSKCSENAFTHEIIWVKNVVH